MRKILSAAWRSIKSTSSKLHAALSLDPTVLLPNHYAIPCEDHAFFTMSENSIARRLWLHAHQDQLWARQLLACQQYNQLDITGYVRTLASYNEQLGAPVKVREEDVSSFTLIDWITVEKGLILYRTQMLIAGDRTLDNKQHDEFVGKLKAAAKTPNWMLSPRLSFAFNISDQCRDLLTYEWICVYITLTIGCLFAGLGVPAILDLKEYAAHCCKQSLYWRMGQLA